MSELNLIVSFISTILYFLLKSVYYSPITSALPKYTVLYIACLSVLRFITNSKSLALNSNSSYRLYQLLSIPMTLIINKNRQNITPHGYFCLTSLFLGCVLISTDSFNFNPSGAILGLGSSAITAILISTIQHAATVTGISSLALQAIASFPRLLISIVFSAATHALPSKSDSISFYPYSIFLFISASALEVAKTVSMTSEIVSDSAISYLVIEQFCEVLIILVGHTLNPTRFTTFSEAILSFMGFILVIPSVLIFLIIGDKGETKPTDVEPFRVPDNEVDPVVDEHSN